MIAPDEEQQLLHAKLNMETSQIGWQELLRYFAGGLVIVVADDLDLVEVAARFTIDDKTLVEQWLSDEKIAKVSDAQASACNVVDRRGAAVGTGAREEAGLTRQS